MSQNHEQYSPYIYVAIGCGAVCIVALLVGVWWSTRADNMTGHNAVGNTPSEANSLASVSVVPVDPAVQQETYMATLNTLIEQPEISDTDMHAFLFETRVPAVYQEAHLSLAQAWSAKEADPRTVLIRHKEIMLEE